MIFAWDALKDLARENLDAARQRLMDILSNYQGYKQCRLVLVFDGYKVKGNPGDHLRLPPHPRGLHQAGRDRGHVHRKAPPGDRQKLHRPGGHLRRPHPALRPPGGVLRLSADELWREVEWVGRQIDQVLQTLNQKGRLSRDS